MSVSASAVGVGRPWICEQKEALSGIIAFFASNNSVGFGDALFGGFAGELSGKLDASGMKYAVGASYTSCCSNGPKSGTWMAAIKT